jgi:predicted NAD/FAD-dependent oxidoreductase
MAATQTIDLTPSPEEVRLDVGIIGAGIAGLGAAIALAQAGHNVEVSPLLAGSDVSGRDDGRNLSIVFPC